MDAITLGHMKQVLGRHKGVDEIDHWWTPGWMDEYELRQGRWKSGVMNGL